MAWELRSRLCLDDIAVPLEAKLMDFVDPCGLLPDRDLEEQVQVDLVTFKSTSDSFWLSKCFRLYARWWVVNAGKIPLLLEIQDRIRSLKTTTGAAARLPRNHTSLLALEVRGKTLWFQNESRAVIFALRQGQDGLDDFTFFLQELQKDIEGLKTKDPDENPVQPKTKLPEDLEEIVPDILKALSNHPECKTAHFLESRGSLRILRKDKVMKDIYVKGLKRKRAESAEVDNKTAILQRLFDQAMQSALSFLSPEVPDEPAEHDELELSQEPAQPVPAEPAPPPRSAEGQLAHDQWVGSRASSSTLPMLPPPQGEDLAAPPKAPARKRASKKTRTM